MSRARIRETAEEDIIALRMELGHLLVRAKLITVEQMNEALKRQAGQGGRFGDHLVALGHMSQEALDAFIYKTPVEPESVEATGIDEQELLALLMKQIYSGRLDSNREFADAIKLPSAIVAKLVRMRPSRSFCMRGACARTIPRP